MSISVNIPKGTRDFLPYEMNRRNYIFSIIKKVFEQYGYTPIETPAMENLSTLMGKYGEEGDKLLFKILNSGDFLSNVDIGNKNSQQLTPLLCEKGLRYDLTVPLLVLSFSITTRLHFLLSVIRFNLFGEPINRKKAGIVNFTNAMWM